MKKKITFLLLILVVNISFLFSGPPDSIGPNSYCPHQYVWLNKFMGVPVNCDEFVFIGGAVRPAYLTEQGFQRQNRPGYIILGTVTGYSIYYLLSPFHKKIKSFASKKLSAQFSSIELEKAVLYGSVYTGFIIINITVLFLSMLLFEKSIFLVSGNWKNQEWLLWLCLVMLISNQVSKIFFWTAHQQMFTIFTPVACIYTGLRICSSSILKKTVLITAFISGLLLLVYGNFILLLPVILSSYLLKLKEQKKILKVSSLFTIVSVVFLFLLPTASWITYLRLSGIPYYNHEISQFRHFIWIKDSWEISTIYFLKTFYDNTLEFLKTSGSLSLVLLFLIVTLLCRSQSQKDVEQANKNPVHSKKNIILLPFLLFIIFLWLIGAYADRLTFSLAPFIVFTGVLFINKKILPRKTQYALGTLILLIHLYTIFFNAPHLSEKLFFQ